MKTFNPCFNCKSVVSLSNSILKLYDYNQKVYLPSQKLYFKCVSLLSFASSLSYYKNALVLLIQK